MVKFRFQIFRIYIGVIWHRGNTQTHLEFLRQDGTIDLQNLVAIKTSSFNSAPLWFFWQFIIIGQAEYDSRPPLPTAQKRRSRNLEKHFTTQQLQGLSM